MDTTLKILDNQALTVGESPLWDEKTGRLYTIDIRGKCIRALDWNSGAISRIDLPQQLGCIALTEEGGLLAAMEDGVYLVGANGALKQVNGQVEIFGRRFNDGKAGPDGRFYVGTTDVNGMGAFYRMDHDGSMELLFDHVGISNGLAWSGDGRTMYYCDSPRQVIEAFDFCGKTGTVENRRTILAMPFEGAVFDGMTIDAEDKLWVALWGASCVLRVDPVTKTILERIDVPVSRTACCLFAGEALDQLVITTAAYQADLQAEPCAGNTFVVKTAVPGLPGHRFRMAL